MDLHNKTDILYIAFALALILVRMPIIGKLFKVFYTMIHELGHAIMTVFTSGEIISISLFADTSGNTITKSKNKFGQFLVAFAGYPIAAVMGFLFFYFIYKQKINLVLFIFAGITLIELVFWIRNLYGILWLFSFILVIFLVYKMEVELYCYAFTVFFSSILIIESFISTIQLIFLSFEKPKNAGDASNLTKLTHLPSYFWALLFFSISVFFIYLAVRLYFIL